MFRIAPAQGFHWLHPIDPSGYEYFRRFSGEAITEWDPPTMTLMPSNDRSPGRDRVPDVPWLADNVLAFRSGVVDDVRPILSPYGQFLPVSDPDVDVAWWVFNVCSVVDALREEDSEIEYFDDGVRIMWVRRWAFDPSMVEDSSAFRISKISTLLLGQATAEALEKVALSGLQLERIWTST